MDIRQLRYFLAVIEHGTVHAAATACGVKQPSLSQQLGKLEDELGLQLFDRAGAGVVPTEAGRAFRPRAESILMEVASARGDLRRDLEQGRTWIAMGAIPTLAPFVVPGALRSLRDVYPDLAVEFTEDTTDRLTTALLDLSLDLIVIATPVHDSRVRTESIAREPLIIVMHPEHEAAAKPSLDRSDLEREGILILHEAHCLGRQVGSFCDEAGLQRRIRCDVGSMGTLLALVEAGLGLTLIPAMAAPLAERHGLAHRPLVGMEAAREIFLAVRRQRTRSETTARLRDALIESTRSAVDRSDPPTA